MGPKLSFSGYNKLFAINLCLFLVVSRDSRPICPVVHRLAQVAAESLVGKLETIAGHRHASQAESQISPQLTPARIEGATRNVLALGTSEV